jgi:hypothetical protein
MLLSLNPLAALRALAQSDVCGCWTPGGCLCAQMSQLSQDLLVAVQQC